MPRNRIIVTLTPILPLAALLVLLTAGAATAQMGQGRPTGQPTAQQTRLMELQKRLATAQDAAMAASPALQKQRADLEALMREAMQAAGYHPDARIATLDSLNVAARSPGVTQEARVRMMQTAQRTRRRLQEAQQVAMQDSSVVVAQETFRRDLMTAMRKEEPETDALVEEYERLQAELRASMQHRQGRTQTTPMGGGG